MKANRVSRCRPLLGTFVEVTLIGNARPAMLHDWANEAFDAVETVQRLMSYQDPHSELSSLNTTAHLWPQPIHAWTHEVLRCACEIGVQSGGVFDIAVHSESGGTFRDIVFHDDNRVSFRQPLKLDLGGIAKGFAVDRAIRALTDHSISYACVNAGGDLRILGDAPDMITVRDPMRPRAKLHRVALSRPAAATSASYFRRGGDEILRPGQRIPDSSKSSITVFATTCMIADALTKVVLLADEVTSANVLQTYGATAVQMDAIPA